MNSFLWAVVIIGLVTAFNYWRSQGGTGASRGGGGGAFQSPKATPARKSTAPLKAVPTEASVAVRSPGRLKDVRDPQLAASILMIQLVRTGAPVTSAEKAAILTQMSGVLKARSPEKLYDQAWAYTENRAPFGQVSDELIDVLKGNLSGEERLELISMLEKTANAYVEASELQKSSISRLKSQLMDA